MHWKSDVSARFLTATVIKSHLYCILAGPVLHRRVLAQVRGQVQGRQRVPRRQLLRRRRPRLPPLRPQAQQDRLQQGVRLLQGGEYYYVQSGGRHRPTAQRAASAAMMLTLSGYANEE